MVKIRRTWIDYHFKELLKQKQQEFKYNSLIDVTRDIEDVVIRKRKKRRR